MKGWALLFCAGVYLTTGCSAPIGSVCETDAQCGALARCALKVCRFACPCLPEETCVEGACYPTECNVPCSGGEVCVDENCADPRCGAHSCAPLVCDPINRYCAAPNAKLADCSEVAEVSCSDGRDNDCDGKWDCEDPDCQGSVCRMAADACDIAEHCDLGLCPQDKVADAGVACRDSTGGACDLPELCDGIGVSCTTVPRVKPLSAICRASQGPCDLVEYCDGLSDRCPTDLRQSSSHRCGLSTGAPCDTDDYCNGDVACPDQFVDAGVICRSSAGVCDVVDFCSGTDPNCADVRIPAGTVCRSAAGICDLAETCTNTSVNCPADIKRAANQTCAGSGTVCDPVVYCNGTSNNCPVTSTEGTACPGGTSNKCCGGACVNTQTDLQNCGACAKQCSGQGSCCNAGLCLTCF